MMGWSPRCYIPSFVEIGLRLPEKKIFKGVLPLYMGMAAILVMGPAPCHQIFISLYLKALIKIWFRSAQYFLRKSGLNFCMYMTLGQGQEMTLTFDTHIPSYMYICHSPDRNLGRSGICQGQIGILFKPKQSPDLP